MFSFEVLDVSLSRAGGISCRLDVLHGGLGINILQFLLKQTVMFFFRARAMFLSGTLI
jgi:hypothetical protein